MKGWLTAGGLAQGETETDMLLLGVYILVTLVAMTWIASDSGTTGVPELFRRDLHVIAREMGVYWSWILTHAWRCAILLSLIAFNAALACQLFARNPFGLGLLARSAAFIAMLIGSLATIPWIFLADYLRVQRRLRSKAAQLASLVALATSGSDFAQELQPAGYDTDDSWTAWHPKQHNWQSQEYWSGIVPVAYVRQNKVSSIVIPLDWKQFLAWKLPAESAMPGRFLPFHGPGGSSFRVTSVRRLRHCLEWTVINAELYDESLSAICRRP